MKKTLALSVLALLLALGLPWLRSERSAAAVSETPPAAEETSPLPLAASPPPGNLPQSNPEARPLSAPAAAQERLAVLTPEGVSEMDMQDYLLGVLAAEMPASFPEEALKAQAVAARSYALYCARASKHGDAQVCTDPGCCQAWQSDAQLRDKWGESYETNLARIRAAVDDTDGQYLLYDGLPAFAAFHSSSAGATEDSGAIWNALPYLVSVSSPETAEDVPNYVSRVQCLPLDFRDALLSACPEADFTGEPESWLGAETRDASGRVASLLLGGRSFTGTQLRSLFRLRSTAFTLTLEDGLFTFTVTGYGHGVGMSQYGAKALAASGSDYAAILAHYYPGTLLVS